MHFNSKFREYHDEISLRSSAFLSNRIIHQEMCVLFTRCLHFLYCYPKEGVWPPDLHFSGSSCGKTNKEASKSLPRADIHLWSAVWQMKHWPIPGSFPISIVGKYCGLWQSMGCWVRSLSLGLIEPYIEPQVFSVSLTEKMIAVCDLVMRFYQWSWWGKNFQLACHQTARKNTFLTNCAPGLKWGNTLSHYSVTSSTAIKKHKTITCNMSVSCLTF